MNAKRCDRCGVFYTPKTGETYWDCDSLHEIGDYSLSQTMGQKNPDGSVKGLTYTRYLDLCKSCQKDFNKMVDKFLNEDYVKPKDKEEIRPFVPGPCDDPLAWGYRK